MRVDSSMAFDFIDVEDAFTVLMMSMAANAIY